MDDNAPQNTETQSKQVLNNSKSEQPEAQALASKPDS